MPLGIGLWAAQMAPARALVPYVFVPQSQELAGAGLGIAQAAGRLLRLGQAEDAARLAALTVQLLPQDPRGWLLLAEAQLRSNQLDEAAAPWRKAKELDPRNPGIWFAQGSLALRNGNRRGGGSAAAGHRTGWPQCRRLLRSGQRPSVAWRFQRGPVGL